jgi:hypothetical protein
MRRILLLLCGFATLATPHFAAADEACNEQSLNATLKKIEGNLAKPSVRKQVEKARADFAADQDFDDIDAALYLDAYALYLDIERNYQGGAIDAACTKYESTRTMFDLLEAAE